jgi:hypothetical protein
MAPERSTPTLTPSEATRNPPESLHTPPSPPSDNNPPPAPDLMTFLSRIADRMDHLELRLTTPPTHSTVSKKASMEPLGNDPCPPPPPLQTAGTPLLPNAWTAAPTNRKPTGKGKSSKATKASSANPLPPPNQTGASTHTEVTILHKSKIQAGKEGCHDPLVVTQQMQASLRAAKSPLVLLSGRWSTTSNFVLTFAGSIPFTDILRESQTLTQPFPGANLVPSAGLSKVTFNGVPTRDPDVNEFFTELQLLSEVRRNPICSDLLFFLQPRWLRLTPTLNRPFLKPSFAFLDPDGSITQAMVTSHLAMFGKAITFKRWQVRPPILQCARCHSLGHQGLHCRLPKDALCCHWCGGNHRAAEHPLKCKKASDHATPGKCDCPVTCITCKEPGHSVRDPACPAREAYKVPAFNSTNLATNNPPRP